MHLELVTALVSTLLLSLLALAFFSGLSTLYLARLPHNHFSAPGAHLTRAEAGWNLLGWLCMGAGVAMLVLPGPGLLTLAAGLFMANYPGKQWVESFLIQRGSVRDALNRLRAKTGARPFDWPPTRSPPET